MLIIKLIRKPILLKKMDHQQIETISSVPAGGYAISVIEIK
jgi:hypothetical protein